MNMVQSSPSASDVVLFPGRFAMQVVKGAASVAIDVAQLPGRLASLMASAEKALTDLDTMTTGVVAMKSDMNDMRESLVEVIAVLQGVNSGVDGMSGSVGGIHAATESLDSKIETLQGSLVNIDLLAARLTRFGGARRARAAARGLANEADGV